MSIKFQFFETFLVILLTVSSRLIISALSMGRWRPRSFPPYSSELYQKSFVAKISAKISSNLKQNFVNIKIEKLQNKFGSLLLHAATNFFSCCMIRPLCCNYECTSHMRSENRQAVIFHSSLKFILIHRVI